MSPAGCFLPSETAEARDARNRAVSTAKIAVLSEVCARIAKAFVEPKHAAGAVSEVSDPPAFRALEHAMLCKIALKIAKGGPAVECSPYGPRQGSKTGLSKHLQNTARIAPMCKLQFRFHSFSPRGRISYPTSQRSPRSFDQDRRSRTQATGV